MTSPPPRNFLLWLAIADTVQFGTCQWLGHVPVPLGAVGSRASHADVALHGDLTQEEL